MLRLEKEIREIEPTPDGWMQFELTGRVVVGCDPPDRVIVAQADAGRVTLMVANDAG